MFDILLLPEINFLTFDKRPFIINWREKIMCFNRVQSHESSIKILNSYNLHSVVDEYQRLLCNSKVKNDIPIFYQSKTQKNSLSHKFLNHCY